jgi:uncharacterized protein YbjT (DUF2867 family)
LSPCCTGGFALAAFLHPEEWVGKDMRVATEFVSAREQAKIFGEAAGKTVHVAEVDDKAFDALKGNPLPEELHAKYVPFCHVVSVF